MVFEGKEIVEYNFIITTPLEVEESFEDRAILTGVVLKLDSATKNGRIYQVEEGEKIANGLIGMPVFYGTNLIDNTHVKDPEHHIGRVFKTIFDKTLNTIKAWVEVWNNSKFPDLVKNIKKGWGFSIGGKATDVQETGGTTILGRIIKKVFGMHPNHLQLLAPGVPRGQDAAKVDDVNPVEESLSFDPCPWGACEVPITQTSADSTTYTAPTVVVQETKVPIVPIKVIRTTKRVIFLDDSESYIV